MTTETINELVECLELALKNFQQDTLPRPAQIKRMREAVAAARAEMQHILPNRLNQLSSRFPGFLSSTRHCPRPERPGR